MDNGYLVIFNYYQFWIPPFAENKFIQYINSIQKKMLCSKIWMTKRKKVEKMEKKSVGKLQKRKKNYFNLCLCVFFPKIFEFDSYKNRKGHTRHIVNCITVLHMREIFYSFSMWWSFACLDTYICCWVFLILCLVSCCLFWLLTIYGISSSHRTFCLQWLQNKYPWENIVLGLDSIRLKWPYIENLMVNISFSWNFQTI